MTRRGGGPARMRIDEADLAPLVERARRLAEAGGRRLLGLTGPPAAGKSTVAERIVAALAPAAVLVPMDGFHLAEAELHRLGRHERKGAPDTFDAAGYVTLLRRLRQQPAGETVYAPRFDRSIEESIAGAIPVEPGVPLVVTEGNYLLVDTGPWAAIRELLDEIWYLELPEPVRLDRLIARHIAYGRPPVVAEARARGTDQRNADLIATTRHRADLLVELSCAGAARD
ncbi:MAG TPA: nucleoside/nucleotide kinase family protein [Natronosporangium sp.]